VPGMHSKSQHSNSSRYAKYIVAQIRTLPWLDLRCIHAPNVGCPVLLTVFVPRTGRDSSMIYAKPRSVRRWSANAHAVIGSSLCRLRPSSCGVYMIPKEKIEKQHVLAALAEIDTNGVRTAPCAYHRMLPCSLNLEVRAAGDMLRLVYQSVSEVS
jgi:hypothetical protein